MAVFVTRVAVCLRTVTPSIIWSHHGANGGDLISAGATLGASHPTGYPTYVLVGRPFVLIPRWDLAHSLNFMSAFSAALTVLVLCLSVLRTLSVR